MVDDFFSLADLSLYDRIRSDPRLVQRKRDSSGLKNYLQTEHKLPLIDAEEVCAEHTSEEDI